MRRLFKIILGILISLAALVLVVLVAAILISRSGWFKDKVRERIISEVERATGGRVEARRFDYKWTALTAEVDGFVLHGTEAADAPPLFRAGKVEVGLKILSVLQKKIDIASVAIDRPELHIIVTPDGKTNFPTPKQVRAHRNLMAEIVNLKVQHFVARNGVAEYNLQRTPIDFRGDDLQAVLEYLPGPPRYAGTVTTRQLHITAPDLHDAAFDTEMKVALEANQLKIDSGTLTTSGSNIQLSGAIVDFASPHGDFEVRARLAVAQLAKWVKLPIENKGEASFIGKAAVSFRPFDYKLTGRVNGSGLAYSSKQVKLDTFTASSNVTFTPKRIALPDLQVAALDGRFRGSAQIDDFKRFRVEGAVENLSVAKLTVMQGERARQLSGTVSGPVRVEGLITRRGVEDAVTEGRLELTAGPGGVPIQGNLDLAYDQRSGVLRLGNSNLTLGTSHVAISGTMGQTLALHITSKNLDDFLSAFPFVGEQAPKEIPIKLAANGVARFDGTLSGPVNDPRIDGTVELTSFTVQGRPFDHLKGNIDLTRADLNVRSLAVEGPVAQLTASGSLGLAQWKVVDESSIAANISVSHGDVQKLLEQEGRKYAVTGTFSGTTTVSGSYRLPRGTAHVQIVNGTAYGETVRRLEADVNYTATVVELLNGRANSDAGEMTFSGAFRHPRPEWTSGQASFTAATRGLNLAQLQHVRNFREGIDGTVIASASGTVHVVKGEFDLDSVNGRVDVRNITVDGDNLGSMQATAATRGQILEITADADAHGAKAHGSGQWQLTGEYPGHGEIEIPQVTLATINELRPQSQRRELPFTGFLTADIKVDGPLKKPDAMRAEVTIPVLQVSAKPTTQPRAGAQAKDLVLRNAQPIVVVLTTKDADIRSAQFTGTDTTLQASGRIAFSDGAAPWNLNANGSINLAILQLFNPDLLASGVSTVNATVRGPLRQPEVNGRLELKKASLYLADVPNGVDNANGVILFDRSRATIQDLSAETGGGKVTFQQGSFVGFSGPALLYRVQATAEHVRYRSPEGVSITVNANLSLAGTSQSSVLSGSVSVMRAGFTPQTDVGSLLASTAKPIAVPTTPNEYLRGIQFDIRVEGAQNLEINSSLTRNIQAEANLRVRGNIEHPIVLGDISVTEGEIDFFGNRYTINRGEITFFNPAKIEPVIDMDLETRVRGITVDITFSGPLNKLNFSYRSDPPLETNQIIALLAVGREPLGVGALANSQATSNSGYLSTGSNALLSQAITAPVAGRLQRFFGVSHIKIDPQLTDITAIPQARLTLEQQISKDITLTYITNLARTQEQLVRIEWDLNRRWSVIALRDENGQFSIDFQYRKRFK